MKKTVGILLFIVMSIRLFAPDDYAIRTSTHANDVDRIQAEMKEAENNVNTFTQELSNIVKFMDSYTKLSSKHEGEARSFTNYVRKHQKSVASCKTLELKLAKKIQNSNISERSIGIKERGIERCRSRLKKLTVTYENANSFFNNSLEKLNEIKEEYEGAADEYETIVSALNDAKASYAYLESTN